MPAWFNKQPFALITPKVMEWWDKYAPEYRQHQFELPVGVPWNNWWITYQQQFPVMEPGKFWWPTGAGRFGVYTGIADKRTVDKWRIGTEGSNALAYRIPGDFRMQDKGSTEVIEVPMYMLPPRAITFSFGAKPMYLVTLVDQRYWWWYLHTGDLSSEPLTTWSELFQFCRSKLGMGTGNFKFDKPHEDYQSPGELLAKASHLPMPVLLDSAAWSVGCRVVMLWDELASCKIMGLQESIDNRAAGMRHRRALAGGYYDMRRTIGVNKRDSILIIPERTVVSFPRYNDYMELDGRTGIEVKTTELDKFTGYTFVDSAQGFPGVIKGQMVIYDTATSFTAKDNEKELTALCKRMVADYLAHEAEAVIETTLVGINYVYASGLYDYIEVTERIYLEKIELIDETTGNVSLDTVERVMSTTKVTRQPWLWRAYTLHHTVGGSSSSRSPRTFQWVIDCGTGSINIGTSSNGTGTRTGTDSSGGGIVTK